MVTNQNKVIEEFTKKFEGIPIDPIEFIYNICIIYDYLPFQ